MKNPKGVGKEPVNEPQGMDRAMIEMASTSKGMEVLLEKWAHTREGSRLLKEWLDTPGGRDLVQKWLTSTDGVEFLVKLLKSPRNTAEVGLEFSQQIGVSVIDAGILTQQVGRMHRPTAGEQARQVKFECSEAFYEQLMEEKLQRNLTLQQLAIRALERYIAVPESVHRRIEEVAKKTSSPVVEYVLTEHGMSMVESHTNRVTEKVPELSIEQRNAVAEAMEVSRAIEAVQQYLEQLPPEKVHMVREALALDLKYYRRSRLKQIQPKKARFSRKRDSGPGSGETEGEA